MNSGHPMAPAFEGRCALIAGLHGTVLNPDEHAFLREARPCGMILFARNCETHAQIRALITAALDAIGSPHALVLIDQEGGRVQRLRPPLGRALPPAAAYAGLYEADPAMACQTAFDVARLVAADLRSLGLNTNCAPVLDLPVPGAHGIIGDRAYGTSPAKVAALADAVAKGYMAGGVLPVIKHIPGHGRAMVDSHLDLPVVTTPHATLSETDFSTFRALSGLPAAMTAHVVYAEIDPASPATTSRRMVEDVIRGEIGFDGLLMSDDLSMQALSGTIRERAERSITAGCDVTLHCNGDLHELAQVAAGSPMLSGRAAARVTRAYAVTETIEPFDVARAEAALAHVLEAAFPNRESV